MKYTCQSMHKSHQKSGTKLLYAYKRHGSLQRNEGDSKYNTLSIGLIFQPELSQTTFQYKCTNASAIGKNNERKKDRHYPCKKAANVIRLIYTINYCSVRLGLDYLKIYCTFEPAICFVNFVLFRISL